MLLRHPPPLLPRPSHKHYTTKSNQPIINLLKSYMEKETKSPLRDGYKVRAFLSAMKRIDELDTAGTVIRSAEDIRLLRGIGPGIARRIEAFLNGQCYQVEEDDSPEARREAIIRARQLADLRTIPGVGPKKAQELMNAGCTGVADVAKPEFLNLLTQSQKIQYRYHGQLQIPISRTEAEDVTDFVSDNISSEFDVTLVGNYRRGATSSSNVVLLLHHPSHVHIPEPTVPPEHTPPPPPSPSKSGRKTIAFRGRYSPIEARSTSLLNREVVKPLTEQGLIATTVQSGVSRWQGIARLPEREAGNDDDRSWGLRGKRLWAIQRNEGKYRNVEINLAPVNSRGAALLALTGDSAFQRELQARAAKLGMLINEFGLWRWRGFWELVSSETEEGILRELGMDYVQPERRNFGFVFK